MKTLVLKFGGAAVATPQHFANIARIIKERAEEFPRLVCVVSAMGDTTDALINLAYQVHPEPPRREYDMLVTVGERISIALLAMALAKEKKEAVSFTGSQSGILTSKQHSQARIVDVRPHRILQTLDQNKVAIVAGFQGVCDGEITTLGRGGSDTTAVALAVALEADHVEFYKDVPGVFTADPKQEPHARAIAELSYGEAMDLLNNEHPVLHPRCVELAERNGIPLQVRCFKLDQQGFTTIHKPGSGRGLPQYETSMANLTL